VPGEDAIIVEGTIVEVLGGELFRVDLANGHRLLAHPGRQSRGRIAGLKPGDPVKLEMSPYDMSKGRILWIEPE
jgi:translation initiation factor IF-1